MLLFQPSTAAPGRAAPAAPGDAPAAPAPAEPGAPATGQPAPQPGQPVPDPGAAPPPPAPGGAWGGMALVLPFLLLFGLLFLMNRGEKKKRTTFESKLKRGDRVITRSGIKGKLIDVTETTVKVEIAPGVPVMMVKGAVEALDPGDSATADPKGAKDAPDGKDAKDKKK